MTTKQLLKDRKPYHRISKDKLNERISYIVASILTLDTKSNIITHVVNKYNVTRSQAYNYYRKANDVIVNRPTQSTQALINKHIAIREDIYKQAEHSRDKLQAVESIAKLQGLDKTTIEVINKTHDDISDDIVLEILTDSGTCNDNNSKDNKK